MPTASNAPQVYSCIADALQDPSSEHQTAACYRPEFGLEGEINKCPLALGVPSWGLPANKPVFWFVSIGSTPYFSASDQNSSIISASFQGVTRPGHGIQRSLRPSDRVPKHPRPDCCERGDRSPFPHSSDQIPRCQKHLKILRWLPGRYASAFAASLKGVAHGNTLDGLLRNAFHGVRQIVAANS